MRCYLMMLIGGSICDVICKHVLEYTQFFLKQLTPIKCLWNSIFVITRSLYNITGKN